MQQVKRKFKSKSAVILDIVAYIILVVTLVAFLFPIYWMVITSFKRPIDTTTPTLIPFVDFQPTPNTWIDLLFGTRSAQTLKALFNSIIIATTSATFCVVMGGATGYGLSRFRFEKWKNRDIAMFILAQRMMPPAVVLVPIFLLFNFWRMMDTQLAIILAHTAFNLPFAVWILRDFFEEIPKEIEEAALVDGCSRIEAFLKISLPLIAPGLVVAWIFCFAFSWNEFLIVMILSYSKAVTLTWLIATGPNFYALEYWTISTWGTIAIIPPMILAVLIQKYIVRGLTFGVVKG